MCEDTSCTCRNARSHHKNDDFELHHVFAERGNNPLILADALENPTKRRLCNLQANPIDNKNKQGHKGQEMSRCLYLKSEKLRFWNAENP